MSVWSVLQSYHSADAPPRAMSREGASFSLPCLGILPSPAFASASVSAQPASPRGFSAVVDFLGLYPFQTLAFFLLLLGVAAGLLYLLRLARLSHEARSELIDQLGKWHKAEQALQESELRYRRLVQLSPDAVFVLIDRRLIFLNAAGLEFLGASRDKELIGREMLDFVHPDDHELLLGQIRHIVEKGLKAPLLDERFFRLDGTILDVEVTAIPQTYENRPAVQIVARDISGRKRAELERNTLSRLGLQLVAADTSEAMAQALREATDTLFRWDAFSFARRVVGTNRFQRILGIDTRPGGEHIVVIPSEDLPNPEFEGLDEYLEGSPLLLNRESETERPMDRFGLMERASASLMFAPVTLMGEVFGVVSVQSYTQRRFDSRDLDLLKSMADLVAPTLRRAQAEEALRESEERYRRLFNSGHDAVFVYGTHPDGRPQSFIEVNDVASHKLAYTKEELLALSPLDIQESAELTDCPETLSRLFTEKHVIFEMMLVSKTAARIPVEINAHLFELDRKPTVLSIARDISERKRAEKALRESEVKFRTLFEKAAIGIFRTDLVGTILETNPAFQQMMGYAPEELGGKTVAELTHTEDWEFERTLEKRLKAGVRDVFRVEKRYFRRDGEVLWINLTVSLVRTPQGEPEFGIGMIEDISTRKQMEERLRFDALHDALTRLPNRNLFLDRLTQAIARTKRNPNHSFAVLYLDVDDFKKINDSLGHPTGDRLLLELSERIQKCLRPEDTVARLGGDEFAILLESVNEPTAAVIVTRRLLDSIAQSFRLDGREVHISASIGLIHSNTGIRDSQEFLRDADTAMYHAKRLGKNRFAAFDPAMHEAVMGRLNLEEEFRRAMRTREFALYYQPVIDLKTRSICGFEALARWMHPEKGILLPDTFIQMAEDTGLIVVFGQWVLDEACRQTRYWQQKTGQPLTINVNLSPRQFAQTDLPEQIRAILDHTQLDPACLTLEVTENILLEHVPTTLSSLAKLKNLGVKLCIDDFGTGYSSLNYLNRFPIDALKIDRSFVIHMSEAEENVEIIRAVRALARTFGLDVVAEGVETAEQLEQLVLMGYQYVQGHYFHEAMDSAAADILLEEKYGTDITTTA